MKVALGQDIKGLQVNLQVNILACSIASHSGADPGVGGPGGQDPPFWGSPKLHKEAKNFARVRAKTPGFST